jgi:hypothetical protein
MKILRKRKDKDIPYKHQNLSVFAKWKHADLMTVHKSLQIFHPHPLNYFVEKGIMMTVNMDYLSGEKDFHYLANKNMVLICNMKDFR